MTAWRSDDATIDDTDWGFILNDGLMADLKAMVEREARDWGFEVDDMLQDVYLWLSVRPDLARQEAWKTVNSARQHVVERKSKARSRRIANEVPLGDES